ncbi:MAG: hypothetical protein AAGJ70_03820 [Pseudomonadota bacterium]
MRTRFLAAALTVPLVSITGVTTAAGQATVPFTSTVAGAFTLMVGTPGVMAPTTDFTKLTSNQAPGTSGTVAAVSTSSAFSVTADAPASFTTPPSGGGDNVTFAATYSGSDATSIGDLPGTTPTPIYALPSSA